MTVTSQWLTEEMVKTMCRKHLTAYKVPKHIEFRDSLPKTNVGKIMRKELREAELRKMGINPGDVRTEEKSEDKTDKEKQPD